MAVSNLWYLTCSACGCVHCNDDGSVMYMETTEEVRDDAIETGWQCYVGDEIVENQRDYCQLCKKEAG